MSGLKLRCDQEGMSSKGCIKYLKKLCDIKDARSSSVTEELVACTRREHCGRFLGKSGKLQDASVSGNPDMKWKTRNLHYMIDNMPKNSNLSPEEIKHIIHLAFSVWSCVSELTFETVTQEQKADIFIKFSTGKHGYLDNISKKYKKNDRNPFDGPHEILAHTFEPSIYGSRKAGNVHFDNDEFWSANLHNGSVNLFNVAVHEIGHALGLEHVAGKENVMAEFYAENRREAEVDLGPADLSAVRSLYGYRECTNKKWKKYFNTKYPKHDEPRCKYFVLRMCENQYIRDRCPNRCAPALGTTDDDVACIIYDRKYCNTKKWMAINCKRRCSTRGGDPPTCDKVPIFNCDFPSVQSLCPTKCKMFLKTKSDRDRCEGISDEMCRKTEVKAMCPIRCSELGNNEKLDDSHCLRFQPSQCHRKWLREHCKNMCNIKHNATVEVLPTVITTITEPTSQDSQLCSYYAVSTCQYDWFRFNCANKCRNVIEKEKVTSLNCKLYDLSFCSTDWFPDVCLEYCKKGLKKRKEKKKKEKINCSELTRASCNIKKIRKNCAELCDEAAYKKNRNAQIICKTEHLNAIFDFVDGYSYLIDKGFLYRRNNKKGTVDPEFRHNIAKLWEGAPTNPTAAVFQRSRNRLILFQGRQVFVVSRLGNNIQTTDVEVQRVVVSSRSYPSNPTAAFIKFTDTYSDFVHIYKKGLLYIYDVQQVVILRHFPFKELFEVGIYTNRIPNNVDGAVHFYDNGHSDKEENNLFFFTGSSYTVAIPYLETGRYKIPSGTQGFSTSYLRCPQIL